jgi:hypothetical protein
MSAATLRAVPLTRRSARRSRCVRTIPEQTHLQGDDFGSIARAAPVLRFVLASCQPSLDVDLASLGKQALTVVRELPESNDSMPLIWNDRSMDASVFVSLFSAVLFLKRDEAAERTNSTVDHTDIRGSAVAPPSWS